MSTPYQSSSDKNLNPRFESKYIDYVALIQTYWQQRKTIFIVVFVFALIGFINAYSAQEEYTSQVKLMPESEQQQSLGGLGGLARQFGVNTSFESGEGIPVSFYPEVAKNLIMLNRLMNYQIRTQNIDEPLTLQEYFQQSANKSPFAVIQKYTIGLPGLILNWVRGLIPSPKKKNTLQIDQSTEESHQTIIQNFNDAEWNMIENLRSRISVIQDQETGIIVVEVMMPDPVLAAETANQVVELLKEYITNYRTEKTKKDLEFIEERLDDAKIKFLEAQQALASYSDRQRGTTRATDDIERQRLENEFSIAFNIYNVMAQRLEETKIRLQEVTPVVSILDPPAIPNQRSEPQRMRIILVFVIIGFVVGVIAVNVNRQIRSLEE